MNPNKKIDRLFQEKLKDLEVAPPDIVWENIEAQLNKKEDKRIIPFWWKMAGAAAILIGIISGGSYFLNTPSHIVPVENTISNSELDSLIEEKETTIPALPPKLNENKNIIVDTKTPTVNPLESDQNIKDETTISKSTSSSNNQKELKKLFNKTANEEHSISQIALNPNKAFNVNSANSEIIGNKTNTSKKVASLSEKYNLGITDPISTNPKDLIQQNQSNTDWTPTSEEKNSDIPKSKTIAKNDELTENSSLESTKDLNPNIDELNEEAASSIQKWSVASVIAPVFYNSFNSNASSLGNQFESNPKEGSNSMAYGVKVGYKINKKISLQSGLSIMEVGFSINDVFMNPTGSAVSKLSNVEYKSVPKIISVNPESKENSLIQQPYETVANQPLKGSLNQEYGYVEIPVELKYNLIAGKFNAHVVTGFSTLFLNSNDVYVENTEFSSSLGEANNLNNVNFSGNFGLDFDYSLHKNLYINLAPTFKIFTNTFSNDAGNYEPYAIGIYTGLNYRFD